MPLKKPPPRASKRQRQQIASENIATELDAGKPRDQAVAIGLRSAGLAKRRKRRTSS